MQYNRFAYRLVPVLSLLGLLGATAVSAHGLFGDGFGFGSTATADEIATRQQTMFQTQATLLGISIDDVKNAWADGKSIRELITEKGIKPADVQARMKDARANQLKSQLALLVSKGVITQSQADKRLQAAQNQSQQPGMGRGGKGMMGWRRGFGF